MLRLLLLTTLLLAIHGQVLKFGECPDVNYQENLELAKYFSGVFYEQKKFWTIFEIGSECINAEYTMEDDGQVKVNNSGLSLKEGKRYFQVGQAYCEKNVTSKCHVRFYPGTPYGDYNLLAADPDKYGLVFTCRQLIPGFLNQQYAWILTREKNVDPKDMKKYLDVFKSNGIDINTFRDTLQNCNDN